MQHKVFFVFAFQRVDDLLVLRGAKRGDHEGLRFTARKQRRAVRARQDGHFRQNRADIRRAPAVDAVRLLEDVAADDVRFKLLDGVANRNGRILLREQGLFHDFLHFADFLHALLLVLGRVGGAHVGLGHCLDLGVDFLADGVLGDVPRLFRAEFGEGDDEIDDRLHLLMAVDDGAEHLLLIELLRFGFHHQHGGLGARDHEVEHAFRHFLHGGVQHVFAVDDANARRPDRAEERHAGDGERRRGTDHGDDIGIVGFVMREQRADDLRLVAEPVDEERADRAVDQAGGEHFLLGGLAFTLEEATGNLAGGEGFFLVVYGQREEIDIRLRRFRGNHGAEYDGVTIGGHHGAIGLTGDAARFQRQRLATPFDGFACNVKHLNSFLFQSYIPHSGIQSSIPHSDSKRNLNGTAGLFRCNQIHSMNTPATRQRCEGIYSF